MNYDGIETSAEILSAFQQCQNAGEEIDLFEELAQRSEPPIAAFVEILQKIKLEPVLALAIQAVGWVKTPEVIDRLRQSDDLLEMLCEKAKSGATDLIKWSAAKTIIAVGFEFMAVSQYLTETPEQIIESAIARRSNQNTYSNDTQAEFINFWVYCDDQLLHNQLFDEYTALPIVMGYT